jgi:hypothetical protein
MIGSTHHASELNHGRKAAADLSFTSLSPIDARRWFNNKEWRQTQPPPKRCLMLTVWMLTRHHIWSWPRQHRGMIPTPLLFAGLLLGSARLGASETGEQQGTAAAPTAQQNEDSYPLIKNNAEGTGVTILPRCRAVRNLICERRRNCVSLLGSSRAPC